MIYSHISPKNDSAGQTLAVTNSMRSPCTFCWINIAFAQSVKCKIVKSLENCTQNVKPTQIDLFWGQILNFSSLGGAGEGKSEQCFEIL